VLFFFTLFVYFGVLTVPEVNEVVALALVVLVVVVLK
jgi:hypothetical protein